MKRIGTLIVGIVLGIGLTLSPQIYGASAKLLGKEVDKQMEVKLNDKVIGNAAVIEGTSYIPVRAFANEYQLEVEVDSKTITLTSPSSEETAKIAKDQEDAVNKPIQIENLTSQIETSKNNIKAYTDAVEFGKKKLESEKISYDDAMANTKASQEFKDNAAKMYEMVKQSLENANSLLAKEQAKLADLEAQLAALQQK